MLKILFTGWRLLLTLGVILAVIVLCGLGAWQLNRMAERRAQNALINARLAEPTVGLTGPSVDPDALDYRRVEARGIYDPSQEILLRNRALNGLPGYHLITPLRLSGSDAVVLVDRGWIPLTESSPEDLRALAEPGEVVVQGVARRSQPYTGGPVDPPRSPEQPRLDKWFRVDIDRIQEQVDYPLLPIFIELQPAPDAPERPRRVATTDMGEGPHLSYAIQWFSFAITLFVGYLAVTYQQARAVARPARGQLD